MLYRPLFVNGDGRHHPGQGVIEVHFSFTLYWLAEALAHRRLAQLQAGDLGAPCRIVDEKRHQCEALRGTLVRGPAVSRAASA